MAEQNQASNPPQITPPVRNASAGDPPVAQTAIPSYPKARSRKRLILLVSLPVLIIGGVLL
jgi:hypothetical protein